MSIQSIKEATGFAKPIIDNNFPIFNTTDYYNEIFKYLLDELQFKSEILVKNDDIVNNEKKYLHNYRIIRNYIIPLSYIIYSFIYIKYQKKQINIQLRLENDLTYDMLSKYFFNHKNPIIKKVNVFFYLNLEGEKKIKNNNKNKKDEDEIISVLKIDDENNVNRKIIKFLGVINDTLPINDLDKKCEDIIKGLTKLLPKLEKLVNDLITIKTKVTNTNSNSSINKKLFNRYFTNNNIKNNNIKNIKVDELLDNISFEKIDKNTKLFEIYRIEYNSCVTQYQNILKDLKNINLNILYINSENYGIIEDNISISKIKEYIDIYKKHTELEKYSNETFKNLKNHNNTIINHLNDKIDLINILLNFELKNNTIKERFKKYFNEIEESKKKIIDETKKVLSINNDKINNEKIKIYKNIYKSIYNYEIIELYYLFKIKKVDISSTNILNKNNFKGYEKINIKDYQFDFDKNFRDYKKNNNSNKNIQDLQNLSSDLIITKKDIDDNSKELDEYITKKNLTSTKSDIEKVQLKKLEEDERKKKILVGTYTTYLNSPSIWAFFTKDSTIIPSDKYVKEQQIKLLDPKKPEDINELLNEFYQSLINNINTEIGEILQNISDLKIELKKLEYEINSDTFKQSIMKLKITNITEYIGKISEILTYFNKIKEDKENNDKILKKEATDNFNFLLIIMEQENNIIDSIEYKESTNKVSYRLLKDELNKIYNNITKEDDKLIKKNLNNYFTNNEETFIEFLNEQKEKSNKDIYKLFFDKYNIYYEEFLKKINNILDNINNHKLKLDTTKSINDFKTSNIKVEKIKKLLEKPSNNNNSGKYTKVLPYTDILLVYLLYLLFIIDYLTYFYK